MDGDQITGGSILRPNFISHGTLGCKNLEKTREFYEAFLGLECVRTSQNSMMIRRGGQHIYAVVQVGEEKDVMPRHYHNGLDVATDEEVDAAYKTVLDNADEWGIHSVNRPAPIHGTYCFKFWDLDDNCWEILSNPKDGYTWIFNQGDQEGRGHMDKKFREKRPDR